MSVEKIKCIVGLSGGVDSATTAALLKENGYDVVGCTLKMFESQQTNTSIEEAGKIAKFLNIRHEIIDCVSSFKKCVMEYFVEFYKNGRTPNPCVLCNENIKFKRLNELRKKLGADLLATGHYARIKYTPQSQHAELHQAKDLSKDQSYFLYRLDQNVLMHSIFPLGEYTKSETRKMAKHFGLNVAEKAESQDVCFIQNDDHISFIRKSIPEETNTDDSALPRAHHIDYGTKKAPRCCDDGNIVDEHGTVLGKHRGIIEYTIGQRKGLGLSGGPFFVKELDPENNVVVVSNLDGIKIEKIKLADVTFINGEFLGNCHVKNRSASKKISAKIERNSDGYIVCFQDPEYGVAKGQHCVFFDEDRVLGGGVIF